MNLSMSDASNCALLIECLIFGRIPSSASTHLEKEITQFEQLLRKIPPGIERTISTFAACISMGNGGHFLFILIIIFYEARAMDLDTCTSIILIADKHFVIPGLGLLINIYYILYIKIQIFRSNFASHVHEKINSGFAC